VPRLTVQLVHSVWALASPAVWGTDLGNKCVLCGEITVTSLKPKRLSVDVPHNTLSQIDSSTFVCVVATLVYQNGLESVLCNIFQFRLTISNVIGISQMM
jgi:hypothetical protein